MRPPLRSRPATISQRTVTRAASIRFVPHLGQPLTFGFRAPVILLPASLRSQPVPIQRAVLAHELWHVRRRDWFWTVCEEVVRAALWFHPGIWILLSRIQSAREEVVDELSILTTGSRRSYADALLTFADNARWFAVTAFARRRHLVQRLVLISKEAVMSARRVVATAAAVIVVVAAAGWYSVQAFPDARRAAAAARGPVGALPGPLESRARPITPENPIPRRTYSRAGRRAVRELRDGNSWAAVSDQSADSGRSRPGGRNADRPRVVMRDGATVRGSEWSTRRDAWTACWRATGPDTKVSRRRPLRRRSIGMLASAIRAVEQWQYAAPAEGRWRSMSPSPSGRRRRRRPRLHRHPGRSRRWRRRRHHRRRRRAHGPGRMGMPPPPPPPPATSARPGHAAARRPRRHRARQGPEATSQRRVVRRRCTSSRRDHQGANENAERQPDLPAGRQTAGSRES